MSVSMVNQTNMMEAISKAIENEIRKLVKISAEDLKKEIITRVSNDIDESLAKVAINVCSMVDIQFLNERIVITVRKA